MEKPEVKVFGPMARDMALRAAQEFANPCHDPESGRFCETQHDNIADAKAHIAGLRARHLGATGYDEKRAQAMKSGIENLQRLHDENYTGPEPGSAEWHTEQTAKINDIAKRSGWSKAGNAAEYSGAGRYDGGVRISKDRINAYTEEMMQSPSNGRDFKDANDAADYVKDLVDFMNKPKPNWRS